MPNFETFTKRMVPLTKAPTVTLQKRGTLSLNKAAHVAMGEPATVELLFDKDEQVIGIRGVSSEKAHAYPVRGVGKDATTFIVAGTAFAKYYGINTDDSRRFPAEMVEDVLCINLRGDSTIVTGNRQKRDDVDDDLPRVHDADEDLSSVGE